MEKRIFSDRRHQLLQAARGRVLDVGAGTGANLPHYRMDQISRLILLDVGRGMLDRAAHKAAELGIDPGRIAVAGDSAGAHLAAVCAQQCAAQGGPAPAFQLLIYPVTDSAEEHPSRRTFADGFILTKERMDWYEAHFLAADQDRRDPRVSPLHAADLSGLPPALVVTAGFDPLRDEGEAYSQRLREAGVRAVLRRHPGYVHGFIHALAVGSSAREALAEMGGVLRAALSA